MTKSAKLLFAVAAFLVALHVVGAFVPTHFTRGFHLFGFYHPVTGIAVLAAALAMFHPRVQSVAGSVLERLVTVLSRLPAVVVGLIIFGLVAGLGFLFSAELHLLGDSAILIRSIPAASWGDDIISGFRNQPLLSEVYRFTGALLSGGETPDPEGVYRVINLLGAALLVALTVWFARKLPVPPVERALLGFLMFTGAGTQFFFGYVENYVLQYVATAAFAVTGWLALERRIHIAVPLLILVVMPGFNLGTIVFFPAALYLVLRRFGEEKLKAVLILAGFAAAGAAVLWMIGFDFARFYGKFAHGSVDFLPLFSATQGIYAYPMFSGYHLADWMNAMLLIFPFGIFIPAVLWFSFPRGSRWNNPPLVFLLVLSACGVLFTWTVNFALGMARDWDNIASFLLPIRVLDIFLLAKAPGLEPRRPVILTICVLSFLHLAGFIGINANADRHLARLKTLDDPRLLSKSMRLVYYEALAGYYKSVKDYPGAKGMYDRYLAIDSLNPRIVANISDMYRELGDRENYFRALRKAADMNSPNPGVYSNLAVEYITRGDTARGMELLNRALEMDRNVGAVHANLGMLYIQYRNYRRGILHAQEAIRLGFRDPALFRAAGYACYTIFDKPGALQFFNSYLELVPGDSAVRRLRDKIHDELPPALRKPASK